MQSHHVNGPTNAVIKRMITEGKSLAEIQAAVNVKPEVVKAWVEDIKAKGNPASPKPNSDGIPVQEPTHEKPASPAAPEKTKGKKGKAKAE